MCVCVAEDKRWIGQQGWLGWHASHLVFDAPPASDLARALLPQDTRSNMRAQVEALERARYELAASRAGLD